MIGKILRILSLLCYVLTMALGIIGYFAISGGLGDGLDGSGIGAGLEAAVAILAVGMLLALVIIFSFANLIPLIIKTVDLFKSSRALSIACAVFDVLFLICYCMLGGFFVIGLAISGVSLALNVLLAIGVFG